MNDWRSHSQVWVWVFSLFFSLYSIFLFEARDTPKVAALLLFPHDSYSALMQVLLQVQQAGPLQFMLCHLAAKLITNQNIKLQQEVIHIKTAYERKMKRVWIENWLLLNMLQALVTQTSWSFEGYPQVHSNKCTQSLWEKPYLSVGQLLVFKSLGRSANFDTWI